MRMRHPANLTSLSLTDMIVEEREFIERWIDGSCKVPIALDDLPKEMTPILAAKPTAYAFLLSSIDHWPIPPSLKKILETAELDGMQETRITCSISMSFYHTLSKRFYGSTWVGHEHPFSIKTSTKRIPIDNLNELTYFQTRINDPNCFIVVELVMAILSPLDGSVSRRYGCGWALVNPFFLDLAMSTGKIGLYSGSPRDLLQLKGSGSSIQKELLIKQRAGTTSAMVTYTIWRPTDLGLSLASCIKENQIVGAHTPIAGLRSTSINYFDNRESIARTCIGATTRGHVLDWTLLPPKENANMNIMARPCILRASNISIKLPKRMEFERTLESWIAHALPKGNGHILNKMSSIFGWNKAKSVDKDNKDHPATTVVSRRLKIGVHNGHTILHNHWHDVDLLSDDGNDPDKLQASAVEISSYIEHHSCTLLCMVEYTVKTVQAVQGLQSPKKMQSNLTTVLVGVAAFSPLGRMSFDEPNAEVVTLNLTNDVRCQALCANPLFSPARDDMAEPQSLTFELCACGKTRSNEETNQIDLTRSRCSEVSTDDKISLDGSAKSRFICINRVDKYSASSGNEAKEDCSLYNWNIGEEITLGNSTIDTFHKDVTYPVRDSARGKIEHDNVDHVPAVIVDSEVKSSYSTSTEMGDSNSVTAVSFLLHSFTMPSTSHPESAAKLPELLSFRLKLYSYDEIMTDSFALNEANGAIKFTSSSSFSFVYDYSATASAEEFARYLMDSDLFVEVFDESKFHLGTMALPMHLFLRQGKDTKTLDNLSVDINAPQYNGHHSIPFRVGLGKPTVGHLAGSIVLSIQCVGSKSDIPQDPGTPSSGPKRVVARRLVESNQDVGSVVANLNQNSGLVSREADDISSSSHVPSICRKSLRQKQLHAVGDFQRQRQKNGDGNVTEELDYFFRAITLAQGQQFEADYRVLAAVQWAREGKKKQLIANHIKNSKEKTFIVQPWVGQTVSVGPFEFTNPMPVTETFIIEASHPGIRLISKSETSGAQTEIRYDQEDFECNHIVAKPTESVRVTLAFDCTDIDDQPTMQIDEQSAIMVSFVSANTSDVVASFNIRVQPRLRVDRRFIIACSENEYLRKIFALEDATEGMMKLSVKCVDKTSTKGVQYTLSESMQSNELLVEFWCPGRSLSSERFYVLFSYDNFNTLYECWEFIIDIKTPIYDTVCLGKVGRKKVMINHDKEGSKNCRVKCFTQVLSSPTDYIGSKTMCACEPKESFQLLTNDAGRGGGGGENMFHILFQFFDEGRRKILIHLVNQDTNNLIGAWIISIQCYLPCITKEYNVDIVPDRKKHIKLPFTNGTADNRLIEVLSSNEVILKPTPDCSELELKGHETAYLRFQILVDEENITVMDKDESIIDVFLFTRDKSTNAKDCFRLRLHVQSQH